MINIVRRESQVEYLRETYGCEYVLNSSSETFEKEFADVVKKMQARTLIECVGGELTGKLLGFLPSRSTCIVYGALSEEGLGAIDPLILIGRGQTIESFILGSFLESQGIFIANTLRRAAGMMVDETLTSKIHQKFTFS